MYTHWRDPGELNDFLVLGTRQHFSSMLGGYFKQENCRQKVQKCKECSSK